MFSREPGISHNCLGFMLALPIEQKRTCVLRYGCLAVNIRKMVMSTIADTLDFSS